MENTHPAAEAARGIYIDFESLRTDPPHPALLGVLIGAEGEELEQLILDPTLAPAQRARPRQTRVTMLSDAADAILNFALADRRRIVAWSNFDRDRLIEARPDLRAAIEDRYVNALAIARPWRIRVHPSFKIEREDRFAPKHTLDKYALLAGYPQASALAGATPAKWIRRMQQQLTSTGGNYRRTTAEAKRDWHRLLAYNRHDLLALRHIVLKSTRELECWRAYERTRFCVNDGARRICFLAGSRSAALDALLERHNARRWAFITAWNPGSLEAGAGENARRQAELTTEVQSLGLRTLPGEGIGADQRWTPEQSLLILDISRGRAERLGRRFGQLAIVFGRRVEKSVLGPTAPTPRPDGTSGIRGQTWV